MTNYATLRIYGQHLDPDLVTEIIGVMPSSSQASGETLGVRERKITIGGWFLTSEDCVESDDIADHIRWLLGRVSDKLPIVSKINEVSLVNIFCCWHFAGWNNGFVLDAPLLLELGRLEVSLDFDIYQESKGT